MTTKTPYELAQDVRRYGAGVAGLGGLCLPEPPNSDLWGRIVDEWTPAHWGEHARLTLQRQWAPMMPVPSRRRSAAVRNNSNHGGTTPVGHTNAT